MVSPPEGFLSQYMAPATDNSPKLTSFHSGASNKTDEIQTSDGSFTLNRRELRE